MDSAPKEQQPAKALPALEVAVSLARHRVSGNAVFMWEAICAAAAPEAGQDRIPLTPEMREFLHRAGAAIVEAALGPPSEFHPRVLEALGLGGMQGKSVAKEFAKMQSASVFLGVYETLRDRSGTDKAEEMLARRLDTSEVRVRARATEARNHLEAALRELGAMSVDRKALGIEIDPDEPDAVLLNMAAGLPDRFWLRGRRLKPRRK